MITRLPYPGLRPFQQHEADIFFGREEQTDELLRKLDAQRFLAVVGSSGCGKSSLVRAGLLPALETGFLARTGSQWRTAIMRPGYHPFESLAAALLSSSALGTERGDVPDAAGFLAATLRRGPLGLVEVLCKTSLPPQTNLLLLVDQFEEIFRVQRNDTSFQADAFVALLLESAAQRQLPIYIVITMRSDYIGDCAIFSGLPEAVSSSEYLTPRLSRDQMRAVIEGPARVFGGNVEGTLVNKLQNEAGRNPDDLPVLQHLLMRMWTCPRVAQRPSPTPAQSTQAESASEDLGRVLTLDHYMEVGGFERALSRHADEAYNALGTRGRQIAEITFRELCEGGTARRDARRATLVSEVTAVSKAMIGDVATSDVIAVADVFRKPQYGFLVPAHPEPINADTLLDISHESLIRRWERLCEWAQKEAESAETYRSLERTAQKHKVHKAGLWGNPDLDVALAWKARENPTKEWAARYGGDWDLALKFLEESKRQRRRRIVLTVAAYAIPLIIAVAGIVLLWRQNQRVVSQSRVSLSRELAAAAEADITADPERSVWLGLQALAASPTMEAEEALERSVQASRSQRTLHGGSGGVLAVAFSRDGKLIAAGGEDGVTRVWDESSDEPRYSWTDHTSNRSGRTDVTALAFSPKANVLATVGADGSLHIRDLTLDKAWALGDTGGLPTSLTFSADGNYIATSALEADTKLWDIRTGRVARHFKAHDGGTLGVSLSPIGSLVATGGEDRDVRIWDTKTGKKLREFKGWHTLEIAAIVDMLHQIGGLPNDLDPHHQGSVTGVAFSPQGNLLATASEDRTIKIWDSKAKPDENPLLLNLRGHANGVNKVMFSPDGRRLATVSSDMTAKIWEVHTGRELFTLRGHTSPIEAVAFSPDGQLLLTGSDDGTIKVWDVADSHTDEVYAVAFSQDGKILASVGRDKMLKLWKVESGNLRLERTLPGHYGIIHSVDFAPSGTRVVTAGEDGRAIIWDVAAHKKVSDTNFKSEVDTAVYSRDGHLLAFAQKHKISLWNADSLKDVCEVAYDSPSEITSTVFSNDIHSKWFAVAVQDESGGKVHIFDSTNCGERSLLSRPSDREAFYALDFSPDGTRLATAGYEHKAKIWDTASGAERLSLPHDSIVDSVAFSHDGKMLATASWDQTARVWDATNGSLLLTFTHDGEVNAVKFSPDDRYLVTACDDRQVHVFPMQVDELQRLARSRLTHPPSQEECSKYLKKATCPPTS